MRSLSAVSAVCIVFGLVVVFESVDSGARTWIDSVLSRAYFSLEMFGRGSALIFSVYEGAEDTDISASNRACKTAASFLVSEGAEC